MVNIRPFRWFMHNKEDAMNSGGFFSFFEKNILRQTNHIAIRYFHINNVETITFIELHKKIIHAANQLDKLGFEPGDRVAIIIENSPLWVITFMALSKLNLTILLIDPTLPLEDIKAEVEFADVRSVVLSKVTLEKNINTVLKTLPIINADQDYSLLDEKNTVISTQHSKDADPSIAVILFTSGTGGQYKTVMLTHENFLHVATYQRVIDMTDDSFTILPCYHIAGLTTLTQVVFAGGKTINLVDRLDANLILHAFQESKPVIFLGVPRFLELFYLKINNKINEQKFLNRMIARTLIILSGFIKKLTGINIGKKFFKSIHSTFGGNLSLVFCGGAPLNHKIRSFYEAIGFNIMLGYGLSETSGCVVLTDMKCKIKNFIGTPIDGCSIRIDNPNKYGIGEICIQSPSVMRGYFKNSEATKACMDGTWFKTGDIGHLDSHGNLTVDGRLKELIVTSCGKKATPYEIESHYHNIPGVAECVVVGIPNSQMGYDETYAAVTIDKTLLSSDLTIKELQHSVLETFAIREGKLPSHLRIEFIEFFDELPQTSGMKKAIRSKIIKEILNRKKSHQSNVAETTEVEEISPETQKIITSVIDIISKVTSIPLNKIDALHHFTEYGIDSLLALEIVQKLRSEFGEHAVPLESLLKNPTIKEFCNQILERQNSPIELVVQSCPIVPPRISPMAAQPATPISEGFKSDVILMTGGTGVLGGYLTKLLLSETNKKLYLLTRAKSQMDAKKKLTELLITYETPAEAIEKIDTHIHFLLGDVSLPFFGISENQYHELENEVDIIIHAAGIVSLHGLYESLVPVNVIGTQNAIDFALATKQKYMIHVSSYSVMGSLVFDKNPDFTELDFDREQSFQKMGYQQTKFEAEYLVRCATSKGLKWNIVRPGDIFGDSKTGCYPLLLPQLTGIFYDILRTVIYTQVAVHSKMLFDITPVDYVAKGLLYLGMKHPSIYGTYHLTNPSTQPYYFLINCMQKIGYQIEEVTMSEYLKRLRNNELLHDGIPYKSRTLELLQFNPSMASAHAGTHVGTTITKEILQSVNIVCPTIDENLIRIYLDYCKKVSYL